MRAFVIGVVGLMLLGCTGGESLELSGRVQRLILDGPARQGELRHVLEQDSGESAELRFAAPVELPVGTSLRVRGRFLPAGDYQLGTQPAFAVDDILARQVDDLTQNAQAIIVDPARVPPPRRLLVVLMNFANDPRQPITVEEARRKIFTGADSTRAFFKEQSYGVVDLQGKLGPTGDVVGWYTIAGFNRPCSVAAWGEAALAKAREAGLDTAGYDNTVFFFPATDACPYLGLGQQPGKLTWINGASIATFNHELGHNLGTPHAGARACFGSEGQRLTMEGTCRDSEYGNPFDVMGAGFRHTHAYNKAQARWLSGSNVVEAAEDGVYTLVPQERPSSATQLLSILRDQDSYYHLEYRQPFGFDDFAAGAPAVNGLIVVLGGRTRQFAKSVLLDMAPETTSYDDAPLGVGKSFEDRTAGLRFTLLSRTALEAKVEVKFFAPATGGGDGGGLGDAGRGDAGDAGLPDSARPDVVPASPSDAGKAPAADANRPPPVTVPVNPAPPPPPPPGGCSYGATPVSSDGSMMSLGVLALGLLVRRRARRWGAVLLLGTLLGCGAEGLPPPNSNRASSTGTPAPTPDAAQPTPDAAPPSKADAGPDAKPDGSSDAVDGGTDAATDLPLPPAPQIVLPTVSTAIAEVCARWAEAFCARQLACAPRQQMLVYGNEEICRARRTRTCHAEFLITTRNEQPVNRTACTDALTAQSCRDFTLEVRLPACDPPGGTLGPGEACFLTAQCRRGLRCKIDADVCGTCQPALAVGADCGWWSGGCPVGTSCYDDRCLAPRKLNESCLNTPAPCERGLQCTPAGCRARSAAVGAACAEADLCDPAQGLFCNLTTKVCDARPAPVKVGERCQTFTPEGGALECADDAACVAASTAVTAPRTCVARSEVGSACDLAKGIECKAPAVCTRGVCVLPKIVMGGMYVPPACK